MQKTNQSSKGTLASTCQGTSIQNKEQSKGQTESPQTQIAPKEKLVQQMRPTATVFRLSLSKEEIATSLDLDDSNIEYFEESNGPMLDTDTDDQLLGLGRVIHKKSTIVMVPMLGLARKSQRVRIQ